MVDTVVVQGHEMALVCVVDVQLQLGFDESQVRVRVEVYSLSQTSSGHWDHCDQELQQNGVVAGVGIVRETSNLRDNQSYPLLPPGEVLLQDFQHAFNLISTHGFVSSAKHKGESRSKTIG